MTGNGQWSWRDPPRDGKGRFASGRRSRPMLADLTWSMPYEDEQDGPAPTAEESGAARLGNDFRRRLAGARLDEDTAAWAEERYARLLRDAGIGDGETDEATRRLVRDGMLYDPNMPGSAWEGGKAAELAASTLDGRRVRLDGAAAGMVFDDIRQTAISPTRELAPYAYRNDDPTWIIDSEGRANPLHSRGADGSVPVDAHGRPLRPLAVSESTVRSESGLELRLVPTRTPDGDLAVYSADRDGGLIPQRIDADISEWNAAYARDGGDGRSRPWKRRKNAIYFRADNGVTLDRDTGHITGSYTRTTPFGVQRFFRYEFAEDLESAASRNSGFGRGAEWRRGYGVE